MRYRIVPATAEHIPDLPEIEAAAATLFPPEDIPPALAAEITPAEEFDEARRAGVLWVAIEADDRPVGFAVGGRLDADAHLFELDVHPAHGRRGIGARLVAAVVDWALPSHTGLTLTTFSHLPWNAPYYERLGFRTVPAGELGPELAAILRAEATQGLDPAKRVAMRRTLAPTS